MKRTTFWIFPPVLGVFAMACRWLLFARHTDGRGLLVPGSLPEILLAVLSALAVIVVFFAAEPALSRGSFSGLANLLLALGMLLPQSRSSGVAILLWQLFRLGTYLSAAALLILGISRIRGKRPFFGLNAAVCIGFLLRLVASYQMWSRIPQMQSYLFPLLAVIFLAAFSYQQCAREVSMGSPLWRLRFGLLGTFACLTASVGTSFQPFYLCAGLWLLGCTLFDPQEKSGGNAA